MKKIEKLAPMAPMVVKSAIRIVDLLIGKDRLERGIGLQLHTKTDPTGETKAGPELFMALETCEELGKGLLLLAANARLVQPAPPTSLN